MKHYLLVLLVSLAVTAFAQKPSPPVSPGKPAQTTPPTATPDDPFVKEDGKAPKPESERAEPSLNYQVLFETFDLSREDFMALLDGPGDDGARYRSISEWLPSGRAKLALLTAFSSQAGSRTVVESIDEVRLPMHFLSPRSEEDPPHPTQFQMYTVGESLELELTADPGSAQASVQIAPRFNRLVKFVDEFANVERPNATVSQPRFAERSLTTNASLTLNQPRLLGTLNAAADENENTGMVRAAFLTVRRNVLPHAKPDALPPGSNLLRIEYSFYSLERAAARELWLAKSDPQQFYEGIRSLAAEKKARLEHACVQVTPTTNRTLTQENNDVRFGIDFSEPQFLSPDGQPQILKKANLPSSIRIFETRNTGFIAEMEPVLEPDGIVKIQFAPQFTRYLGKLEVTGVATTYPRQPVFESRKYTGFFSATVGRTQFFATLNPPVESGVNGRKDDGRVWLGFLRPVVVK